MHICIYVHTQNEFYLENHFFFGGGKESILFLKKKKIEARLESKVNDVIS